MYTTTALGLDDAMKALSGMLGEANKDPSRPLAFSIVDLRGDLVCYARMDGVGFLPQHLATRKAYTAARMRNTTKAWGEGLKDRGMTVGDFADPMLVPFGGGVPILTDDGVCVGGIGVSGRPVEEEAIAELGIKALTS